LQQRPRLLAHHPLVVTLPGVQHVVAVAADPAPRARPVQLELLLRQFLTTVPADHHHYSLLPLNIVQYSLVTVLRGVEQD